MLLSRSLLLLALPVAAFPVQGQSKPSKPQVPAIALATATLAGQPVAVLPITMLVSDPRIPGGTGAAARKRMQSWADSTLGEALQEQAPEVEWLLPDALRRSTQRTGGLVPSPDRMGHAVMRAPGFKDLPDPLRSYVRQLVALQNGGRFALIPAALYVTPGAGDSLTVQLSAVLADGRLGRIVWRTLAVGTGETMAEAFAAAIGTILVSETTPPPS
ncbi:MAG: hypothetical protein HOP28_18120 [Gemmatimonadales bacterium]|nr:hypothetical protein [Gemmatimonadales bacterium]